MTVNELAQAVGASTDAIRHYTKVGLLSPRRDPVNHYRSYTGADQKRLIFIRNAQRLGFKLGEIKQILADGDDRRSPCPRVRELMEKRIAENQARLQELTALQARMQAAYTLWESMPDSWIKGEFCPLIEALGNSSDAIAGVGDEIR